MTARDPATQAGTRPACEVDVADDSRADQARIVGRLDVTDPFVARAYRGKPR
jgi:hypothetical protein